MNVHEAAIGRRGARAWARAAGWAALSVLSVVPVAWAQTPEPAIPFVRPMTCVPPELPPAFGTQFAGTVFTLNLTVDPVGRVQELDSLEPANEALRKAIDEVAGYWIFNPQVDHARCETESGPGKIQLEFAPGQPRPRMWMDVRRADVPHERAMKMTSRPRPPQYPSEALREGVAANVYATAWMQPDGSVTDVKTAQLVSTTSRLKRNWGFDTAVQAKCASTALNPAQTASRCASLRPLPFASTRAEGVGGMHFRTLALRG
jgi:hypothetical protein